MIKRILIIFITFLLALSGFLTGFFSVGCMSVYASVNDDSVYVPLRQQSDAVIAFQAYCKSRDLTIEGSLTDAVTTFTTGAFNSACNEVGINITQLQSEIKAEYDQAGKPVKFLFNDTGVMAMNRIFAQFLQDNELEVGDNVEDKTVYDGYYFTDDEGYSSLVWVIDSTFDLNSGGSESSFTSHILSRGTYHKYNTDDLISAYGSNPVIHAFNSNYSVPVNYVSDYNGDKHFYSFDNSSAINNFIKLIKADNNVQVERRIDKGNGEGFCIVYTVQNSNKLYIGRYSFGTGSYYSDTPNRYYGSIQPLTGNQNNNNNLSITIISLTTNNQTINNNTYEGDTIINNEGDIINNYPSEPNNPNDTIHNVPETPLTPNDDGGWDIDLPDIDIPNLPIGNLSEKFPFSIPWDLVAFYAMLDAEPEAPRFNGTMDLTLVQWNYDIDLSPFDSAAELCRKLQFGLFVVGLIVASRSIIRG